MNKGKGLEELAKNMPEPKNIGNKQNETEDKGANNADEQKDNTENVKDDDIAIVEPVCEQFSKMKYYKDFMDELIEARLPKILPKFKDVSIIFILVLFFAYCGLYPRLSLGLSCSLLEFNSTSII